MPFLLQLLGAALVDSNSKVSEWLEGGGGVCLKSCALSAASGRVPVFRVGKPRHIPSTAPPFCSTTAPAQELNWAARLAAFFAWLLLLRPRFLSDPAVSGSSLEQHRRDTGAASVTSPAGWREQAEALQRQLLSGLEEVTSRRRRSRAA